MNLIPLTALLLGAALLLPAQTRKPVEANWGSLAAHQAPAWLADAKFGIYAHWGVYSVPAYGHEWYAKRMYDPSDPRGTYEHHRKTYGTQDKFGYKVRPVQRRRHPVHHQGRRTLRHRAGLARKGQLAHQKPCRLQGVECLAVGREGAREVVAGWRWPHHSGPGLATRPICLYVQDCVAGRPAVNRRA